ncbi:MAG: phosphoglucosamine mutase [Verrucomicrobia bacterium]|nr:phosphoglucosamine mutase [Verrucomicrobiota bacterium]
MKKPPKLFGTDGVRGVANTEPMTAETALKLGRAAAHVFKRDDQRRHRIVIGKDTRLSGYMLENALVAGICSMGVDALLLGPLPTPAVAFITRSLRADAGVMLSASHNPYMDNGIKFFSNDGFKLPDELECQMEAYIASGELDSIRPTAAGVGKAYRIDDALGRYIEFIKNSFPKGMTLDGLKIVLDVANGAPYKVAPRIFTELGAEVVVYSDEPNGMNINDHCGALYPEVIRKGVIDHRADLGISLDGDGDRCIMADDDATVVDGDDILAIAAADMKAKGLLTKNAVVATVMSNFGLVRAMQQAGIELHRSKVGDRYVIEAMLAHGVNLGGEQSGHIIFSDYTTTGDGLITALQVLRVVRETGRKLSDLRRVMRRYPQVLVNVPVRDKPPVESLDGVQAAVRAVEQILGEEGRVLVRYSGTEYLARVMVEGREEREVKEHAERIADAVRAAIG